MIPAAPGWTTPVFFSALVVGLVLVAAGIALQALVLISLSTANLIACSGLGIVLGAFGASATVKFQGIVVAGVAGVTVALYLLLTSGGPGLLKVSVDNVPSNMQATLRLDHDYPGTRVARLKVDFYIAEQVTQARTAQLDLSNASTEINFNCIPAEHIARLLGSGRTTEWVIAADQESLRIDGSIRIKRTCSDFEERVSSLTLPDIFSFVGAALAQEPLLPIETYLTDLDSSDSAIRRGARSGLAQWGLSAVPAMMELWRKDPTHYRHTLGVSVALTEYLREHKDEADALDAVLKDEDLELLVDAAAAPDRTLRLYATEFLFDLGSPRVTDPILSNFAAMSGDGQFNSLFVLDNVIPKLPAAERPTLAQSLKAIDTQAVGSKTAVLLRNLINELE